MYEPPSEPAPSTYNYAASYEPDPSTSNYTTDPSNYSLLPPEVPPMETAEEIVHRYDPLTAVLIEELAINRKQLLQKALAPALSVNGKIVDRQRIFVAKAPHLPDRNDLELMQDVLNHYFREVLGLGTSVYNFLQNSPGDAAVGYLYFACILHEAGLKDDEKTFRRCCDAMKSMYSAWAEEVGKMFPLVLNLNGRNVIKEMMNIVNQSVYRLVAFIMFTQNMSVPELFYKSPAPPQSCEERMLTTNVAIEQQMLTNVFNERFQSALQSRNVYKFYSEERETPYVNLTRIKLHIPKFTANQLNLFEIER